MMKEIKFNFEISNRYTYFVSENGEIFKKDNRNQKISECFYHVAHGYKRIRITDISCGIRRYIRVSRLVGLYFVENTNQKEYNIINHIDGNKQNNNYKNLEWCNISENTQHAYDNGLIKDRGGWISTPYSKRFKQ